jgi:hypothetical protein
LLGEMSNTPMINLGAKAYFGKRLSCHLNKVVA